MIFQVTAHQAAAHNPAVRHCLALEEQVSRSLVDMGDTGHCVGFKPECFGTKSHQMNLLSLLLKECLNMFETSKLSGLAFEKRNDPARRLTETR